MFKKLRKLNYFPDFMRFTNITSVPKSGSKLDLKNIRGVNRVSVIRSIFMRMFYNVKYSSIDQNISDCQMGGRRKKAVETIYLLLTE